MNNATFIEYDVKITLGCPRCDYIFQYVNYNIPTDSPTYHTCGSCDTKLFVAPASIKVEFNSLITKEEPVIVSNAETIKKAKDTVRSYGFDAKEVDAALDKIDAKTMDLASLIKDILANLE
tara:strand:- start:19 stop:381 length:363 start_codon:yes stop_codon:yes gene_type:complete